MRGSIKQRSDGSWTLVFDAGYVTDPATGQRRRRQRRVTVRGTKKQAQARLVELLRAANRGELVEPSRRTLGDWLMEWIEKAIRPPAKTQGTYRAYSHVVRKHIIPAIGAIPLQELKAADIKRYYTDSNVSGSTLSQHHAIIHSALKAATLEGLVFRNVAALVIGKPQRRRDHADVARNCWEVDEVRAFLAAAKAAGPQPAALYAVALDSGARKNELCGLHWSDLDVDHGTVTIVRQLIKLGRKPEFGPVKNGVPRTVDLATETIELLKAHRRAQAELKMRNRTAYHDLGLIFAKELGRSARPRGLAWPAAPIEQHGTARVRPDSEGRQSSADHNSRPPPHVGDAPAQSRRSGACRPTAARTQARRDHTVDLRARVAVDAAGRGPPAGKPALRFVTIP
ncbi:MAG: tyrosine-type recombinase/integrase [Vicinamibacterales bacterium]